MNQSDSGWRKRQIALEKKAENARELGLDYEPKKTIIEMAREAGAIEMRDNDSMGWGCEFELYQLEAFAALVRADEREACAREFKWRQIPDDLPQAIPFVTPEELEELLKNS